MRNGFILSKTWYYILSCTWGILMTLAGALVAGILLVAGYEPHKNIYGWYFECGEGWGGFNAGPISIVSKNPHKHTLQHEFGHSIQNCIFGPLILPYVVIPSVCRYWYRTIKNITSPPYDYAWFEGQATMFGERYYDATTTEAP